MAQYIDKDTLAAEIEKYISNYKEILNKVDKSSDDWVDTIVSLESKIDVLQHILSIIDTIEVKEVDLEKEIELIKGDYEQVDVAWNNDFDFIARHFFELGLKTKGGINYELDK